MISTLRISYREVVATTVEENDAVDAVMELSTSGKRFIEVSGTLPHLNGHGELLHLAVSVFGLAQDGVALAGGDVFAGRHQAWRMPAGSRGPFARGVARRVLAARAPSGAHFLSPTPTLFVILRECPDSSWIRHDEKAKQSSRCAGKTAGPGLEHQ